MAYSGKRNYKSRREKYHHSVRILKVVFVVALLFLAVGGKGPPTCPMGPSKTNHNAAISRALDFVSANGDTVE